MVFAVVTGGGTSGHVIPALAVLEALEDAGYSPEDLRYVGSQRGIETRLMKSSPVESHFLPISGLQRSFSLSKLMANAALPLRLFRSTSAAIRLIRQWNPKVVISLGGYASEPMARAARKQNIPLVCISYDRIPGLATKRQQRYAIACAVAFEDSDLERSEYTGAPVRRSIRSLNRAHRRADARRVLDIASHAKVVTVVGGSLGSGLLNNAIPGVLHEIVQCNLDDIVLDGTVVLHICGERFLNEPIPDVPTGVTYRRFGYVDQMSDFYAVTDVLVCRAGASTVAEIATVGLSSIIVPWKDAADNHQELNARWLSDAGAAIMLTESQVSSGLLGVEVTQLLSNEKSRIELEKKALDLGSVHRSNRLVELIQRVAMTASPHGESKESL
jgi:UDP-N-acetylglucosamine--N-acetylmuramyl-(pentapeptide) pyrophosphoryl-undecaprenol N-acetylglucosamine transferase